MGTGEKSVDLRVEYTYDAESRNWCFRVPNLHIIGSADTRAEAEDEAISAVLFALEYYERDELLPADVAEVLATVETEVGALRVTVGEREPERSASRRRAAGFKTGS